MLPTISKQKTVLVVTLFSASVGVYFLSQKTNFPDLSGTKPLPKFKEIPVSTIVVTSKPKLDCKDSCAADDIMCRSRNLSQWNDIFQSPDLRLKPFLPDGAYIFPWEKDYLSFPPLTDLKTLPDLTQSSVVMSGENQGWVACDVGQRLTGRLDVRDGYGRQRQDGLDEVRMWIVDERNTKRRAVGQVTDFRNGSYGLEITCLWPGSISDLRVAIFYPREYVRAAIQQKNQGLTRYTAGLFQVKPGVQEATLCLPYATLPGRADHCVCNFTAFNGREYYCGQPLDKRLNCSHWTATFPLNLPPPYRVTTAEKQLIHQTAAQLVRNRVVGTTISIRTSTAERLPNAPTCYNASRNITWDMATRPQGFWDAQGTWRLLRCKISKFSGQSFLECLKNSEVYVIGDSNANRIYSVLVARTRAMNTMPGSWPHAAQAKNTQWNVTINFYPHDYPLFLGQSWEPLLRYGSVEQILDRIPSTGRRLVILHYYLHLTPFHLSVARSRVEAAATAISRLLIRNPEARVAFRGPHVASKDWDDNPSIGGDVLGKHYLDIISTAFKNLKDKVIFLDGWEMTTALENAGFHPHNNVPYQMFNTFMSFLCK